MYFTIRSYMEKFQKKGKGTLILKKGTYTITNTIHVPSNVTIIFEKGVKIVKGTKTNKKKMPAAITLFQLIRPSNAKKKDGIAFDVAHNDGVTIEKERRLQCL